MENALEEQKSFDNLADELVSRSSNDIMLSWRKDAEAAAERLSCGIQLVNTGNYNNGEYNDLSFPKKALTIIAGKTGGGKTTTMLNVAVSLCMQGKKGIFLTLEEAEFSLACKTMAIFDSYKRGYNSAYTANEFRFMMKTGKIKDWELLKEYKKTVVRNLIFVDANKHAKSEDAATPSSLYDPRCLDIFASSEFFSGKVEYILADYIQLMQTDDFQAAAYVNVKKVMQAVRYMCGQHDAAIIMGAQLNREAAKLDMVDWVPEMLREAADIEQGANMIIAAGKVANAQGEQSFALRILKNRDGNPFQSGVFDISYPHQFITSRPEGGLQDVD